MLLKQARERKGISQGQLSKALGFSNPQFISNIERGLSELPTKHFKKVEKILGIPMPKLIEMKIESTQKRLRKVFKVKS